MTKIGHRVHNKYYLDILFMFTLSKAYGVSLFIFFFFACFCIL